MSKQTYYIDHMLRSQGNISSHVFSDSINAFLMWCPWAMGILYHFMRNGDTWNKMVNHYPPVSSRDLRASDANGFVQRAISAANVYNNIVKYIDDANITSLTTFNLSQRAEDVGYITSIWWYLKLMPYSVSPCVFCVEGCCRDQHYAWTPCNTERQCFQGICDITLRTIWYGVVYSQILVIAKVPAGCHLQFVFFNRGWNWGDWQAEIHWGDQRDHG